MRVPIFEGPKYVGPFHQLRPTLWSGVLVVIHFGTHKVHFVRLETWFFVNGTLKYNKGFVFYSPNKFLFWIWLSRVLTFEGPKSVCPFHQHGLSLWSGVLLVKHFGTPKVHFIRLEAWLYVNDTLKYEKSFCLLFPKRVFSEFGSCEFQFLKVQSPCALFISSGQLYEVIYCLLSILAPPKFISLG